MIFSSPSRRRLSPLESEGMSFQIDNRVGTLAVEVEKQVHRWMGLVLGKRVMSARVQML